MIYFEQVFLFWRLINKNVFEWFLLITCKEHTLNRSTARFSRNHPKLCFWLGRKCRQTPSREQLLHQTDKNSHRRCSMKKAVLKNLAIFTGKYLCWNPFLVKACNFIKKRLQSRYFPIYIAKFLKVGIHLYNSAYNSSCRKYVTNCSNIVTVIM